MLGAYTHLNATELWLYNSITRRPLAGDLSIIRLREGSLEAPLHSILSRVVIKNDRLLSVNTKGHH